MEIDSLSQHILALLENDARQSATDIGRTIGLSRTAVQERIKKLEQKGVIRGYRVIIDSPSHESTRAVIFVKIGQRPCDIALTWLSNLNGVQEVISLSGEWDAIVRIRVASTAVLSELNDTIADNEFIKESISQIVLKTF